MTERIASPPSPESDSRCPPHRPGSVSAVSALWVGLFAVAVVIASYAVFVRTMQGQRLDDLAGGTLARPWAARGGMTTLLDVATIGSIALVLGICMITAVVGRRWVPAAGALVLVVGAGATSEALKHVVLTRPGLGWGTSNTLPSGHTTVIASLVFAAVFLLPASARWLVRLVGSVELAAIGVGTVIAGWHHPSDVVAGLAVSLAWGAVVVAAISTVGVAESSGRPRSHWVATVAWLGLTVACLVAVGVRADQAFADRLVMTATISALTIVGAVAVGVFARLVDAGVMSPSADG